MQVEQWLEQVPAVTVYVVVALVVSAESVGVPVPGETVLIAAALMASQHDGINPFVLAACAAGGAVGGDSLGYAVGRRYGRSVLERLSARFPKHFGPERIGAAERAMQRWGMRAVFFGRFLAWLRILAGPLAGVLHMPYGRFLTANVLGSVVWAGGTTAALYYLGVVAEAWLRRFTWAALAIVAVLVAGGVLIAVRKRRRAARGPGGPAGE